MADYSNARTQLTQARQALTQQRSEVERAKKELEQERSNLPTTESQEALRSKLGGIQGRQKRISIESKKKEIGGKLQDISQYQEEVLSPYQERLSSAEQELSRAEEDQQAREQAQRLLDNEVPVVVNSLPDRVRYYYEKLTTAQGRKEQLLSSPEKLQSAIEKLKSSGLTEKQAYSELGIERISSTTVEPSVLVSPNEYSTVKKPFNILETQQSKSELLSAIGKSKGNQIGFVAVGGNINVKEYNQGYGGKEFYSSELGGFISESPTGKKATGFVTPKPYDTMRTESIFKIDINNLRRKIASSEKSSYKVEELTNKIKEIEEKSIDKKTKEFIGSAEDYERYKRYYKQLESEKNNLESNQVSIGFITSENRPVSEYKYLTQKNPIARALSFITPISESFGADIGTGLGNILPKKGFYTFQEKKIDIVLPYQERGSMLNAKGFSYTPSTEITIPESYLLSSEKGKSIGNFIGRSIPYVNPVGGYIFLGEQLGKYNAEVEFNEGSLTKGGKSFIKKYPFETLALVGGAVLSTGIKGRQIYKNAKYGKYFEPEVTIKGVETRTVVNQLPTEPQQVIKVSGSINPSQQKTITLFEKIKKGFTTQSESYSTDEITGVVKERIKGNIEGTGSFLQKGDKLTSTVNYIDNYGRPLVKETNIVGGKGSSVLRDVKTGEVLYLRNVKGTSPILKLSENKEVNTVEYDIFGGNQYRTIESKGMRIIKDKEGNIVYYQKGLEPKLGSVRTVGKVKQETSTLGSIEEGTIRVERKVYSFEDVIQSSPRKTNLRLNNNAVNIKQGVTIEYGSPDLFDVTTIIKTDKALKYEKRINPTVYRKLSEETSISGFQIEINPKSKLFRDIKEIEKIKNEEIGKIIESNKLKAELARKEELANQLKNKVDNSALFNFPSIKDKGLKDTLPSYVGREGGKGSQSIYGYNKDFQSAANIQIEDVVRVTPPESILKGTKDTSLDIIKIESNRVNNINILEAIPKTTVRTAGKLNTEVKQQNTQILQPVLERVLDKQQNTQILQPQSKTKLREEVIQTQIPSLRLREDLKLTQKTEQKLRQRTEQTQRNRQERRLKNPPNEPTTRITPSFSIKVKEIANRIQSQPDIFEAVVRRSGKEVSLGKFGTKSEAERSLLKSLKSTLSASGKVKKGGKALKFSELDIFKTGEFRPSKLDTSVVVQRKTARFGTRGETKEAQYFKKRTNKPSKFLGF